MRASWNVAIGIVILVSLGMAGCGEREQRTRLNAPPQGDSERQDDLARAFAYHKDQGMLADMSIADIHFVPHSAILSGVGEARLERYAELLATRGGTIAYQTGLRDGDLVGERLAVASEFLAQAIPGGADIDMIVGLAGGRGMTAVEASTGRAVAEQAEPRGTAYRLDVAGVEE